MKQQDLIQRVIPGKHGGWRPGAGRPRKEGRASEAHRKRPKLDPHAPQHVILRAVPGIRLRSDRVWAALNHAVAVANAGAKVRVVHLSVQQNHVHLIVESTSRLDLARGMQGFQVSAARRINQALGRGRGQVFADRYHAVPLSTPRQVRNTLAYVLNNWRHHGEDKRRATQRWTMDRYSSAVLFDGWAELGGRAWTLDLPAGYEPAPVRRARTWLLGVGWRKRGLISLYDVPGGRHAE